MSLQSIHKATHKLFSANFSAVVLFCIVLYGLAILQDYIFSRMKLTGFYWSETMLYNVYWLLFIPFVKIADISHQKVNPNSLIAKIIYAITTAFSLSALHIILFTCIFILGSHLMYAQPHRFLTILKSAISNQSQITIVAYLFMPFVFEYLKKKRQTLSQNHTKTITIKNGTRRVKIDLASIVCIETNRPYTTVHLKDEKFLHDESLKKLESFLDSEVFLRVHRSAIINKNHITELRSRKNGDYDGILTNGQTVRFSRHYRENWNALLNH